MWHYQLIKYEGGVGLHEVYKTEGSDFVKSGYSYTEEPSLFSDSKEGMLELLKLIAADVEKYPVLDWNELNG